MKENSKNETKGFINPSDFKDLVPVHSMKKVYPDLYTQARYLNLGVERVKKEMVGIIDEINQEAGSDNVKMIIDSIYHFVDTEISISKDCEDYFDEDNLRELSSNVYHRAQLAKHLLDLICLSNELRSIKHDIDLTKQHILL